MRNITRFFQIMLLASILQCFHLSDIGTSPLPSQIAGKWELESTIITYANSSESNVVNGDSACKFYVEVFKDSINFYETVTNPQWSQTSKENHCYTVSTGKYSEDSKLGLITNGSIMITLKGDSLVLSSNCYTKNGQKFLRRLYYLRYYGEIPSSESPCFCNGFIIQHTSPTNQ